jgi:RNA-binding protein YhbY
MKPVKRFQIGKNRLTPGFIEQIKKCFDSGEDIIKISILKSSTRDRKKAVEIAEELIKNLGKNFTYKLIGYVIVVMKWRKPRT